jgi:hypothetical protein
MSVRERGKGRAGRGCCARCFTPWMCADTGCPCHVPQGVRCRFCGTGLFVALPDDERPENEYEEAA